MRIAVTVAVALVLSVSDATALSGNDFTRMSELERAMYIEGVLDGFSFMAGAMKELKVDHPLVLAHETALREYAKCIEVFTRRELVAIVDNFLKERPETRRFSAAGSVVQALDPVCLKERRR